jgi:hypothetical protein
MQGKLTYIHEINSGWHAISIHGIKNCFAFSTGTLCVRYGDGVMPYGYAVPWGGEGSLQCKQYFWYGVVCTKLCHWYVPCKNVAGYRVCHWFWYGIPLSRPSGGVYHDLMGEEGTVYTVSFGMGWLG